MGEYADYALDELMNQYELECEYGLDFDQAWQDGVAESLFDYNGAPYPTVFSRPSAPKTCRRCNGRNLHWQQTDRGWRLFESNGKEHCCGK